MSRPLLARGLVRVGAGDALRGGDIVVVVVVVVVGDGVLETKGWVARVRRLWNI